MPNTEKPLGNPTLLKTLLNEFGDACYKRVEVATEEERQDPLFYSKVGEPEFEKLFLKICEYRWETGSIPMS